MQPNTALDLGGITINRQLMSIWTLRPFSYGLILRYIPTPVPSLFMRSWDFQIQIQNAVCISIVLHLIRLSLSFQSLNLRSWFCDWTYPLTIGKGPLNSVLRTASQSILFQLLRTTNIPCSVIGSTSPSLRWLYRFCNLFQRPADSRAQLGVPNYQKPDLNDNVCSGAKHPPAQGLTVHPVQSWVARTK